MLITNILSRRLRCMIHTGKYYSIACREAEYPLRAGDPPETIYFQFKCLAVLFKRRSYHFIPQHWGNMLHLAYIMWINSIKASTVIGIQAPHSCTFSDTVTHF